MRKHKIYKFGRKIWYARCGRCNEYLESFRWSVAWELLTLHVYGHIDHEKALTSSMSVSDA